MGHHSESSVVFNLAEIMRLEAERVAAEQAAADAAVAREARERERQLAMACEEAERIRVQAIARQAAEREDALRREREHQETLQRIRREAEAAERLQSEALTLEHTRALEHIAREARRSRSRHAVWLLCPAFAIAGAIATWATFELRTAAPPYAVALPVSLAKASEPENARTAPSLPAATAKSGKAPLPTMAATPGTPVARNKPPRTQPRRVIATPAPILDVDTSSDDPLLGLFDEPRPSAKRPRRAAN